MGEEAGEEGREEGEDAGGERSGICTRRGETRICAAELQGYLKQHSSNTYIDV